MKQKKDVQQGTLVLMVLKTLDVLGPLHGYGIARRIEQISGELLSVNQGTLISRYAEARAGGCHHLGVGPLGKQPPSALLSADACGTQITGSRKTRLGTGSGNHSAL